jgi:3-oxoadipate enol-lactonase
MEKINLGKYNIAIDISGTESKPWIILSNSLGTTHKMWAPQMDLLNKNFKVLRYDTLGHGESDAPDGPYTFNQLEQDVISLMDALSILRANFLGLSIGGMVGLGLAINYPNRINKLICADARAEATESFIKLWEERDIAMQDNGVKSIWAGTKKRWFYNQNIDTIETFEKEFCNTSINGLTGCGAALKELDYKKYLGKIKNKTLYLGGLNDAGAPADIMEEMSILTPKSIYIAIERAAHIANVDNPIEFNKAISEFLEID